VNIYFIHHLSMQVHQLKVEISLAIKVLWYLDKMEHILSHEANQIKVDAFRGRVVIFTQPACMNNSMPVNDLI
jgi:hypothetical protein